MSRSLRALAEGCARTVAAMCGLGNRARKRERSPSSDRIGATPPLTPLKWMAITGVVVLAFAPATALAKSSHSHHRIAQQETEHAAAQAHVRAPRTEILAFGAGYADVNGSAPVRALQRRLMAHGVSPGPIDGLYGPLTEHAVIEFQADHGLHVDGIAGPQTLGALRRPILYPGAGYTDVNGSAPVRALQRRLAAEGDSPGPIDGLYGPLTEHAVIKLQAAHRLHVSGIADPRTFAVLRLVRLRATTRSVQTPNPRRAAATRRSTTPAGGRRPAPRGSAKTGSTDRLVRSAARRVHGAPGSNAPLGWVLLIATVLGGVLLAAIAATRPQRRTEADHRAPGNAQPQADRNGKPPETSTGVRVDEERPSGARGALGLAGLLERQGDQEGAVAAHRRADRLGRLGGACALGVLLEERGDLDGAEAAYRRAAHGGDPNGAFKLGKLLEQRGASDEAMAAYRRADQLGHALAACNLGALLEERGDLEGAEAAYQRAGAGGDATPPSSSAPFSSAEGTLLQRLRPSSEPRRSDRPR